MPVVTNHQYEAPILPTSWTGDEKKFYTRLIDVLDEIYSKYGRLSLKDLSPAVRKQLSELVDNTTFQTVIEQTEREIQLKADASTVDALGQTVASHSTQIQQNASAIALKASQSSVDALGNRVTSAETSLTLKADQATLTSTANNLQSQIDAVPGEITLAVNNVQVGGTNLLLKTSTALSSTLSGGTNRIIGSYAFSNQYLSSTKAGKQVTCSFDWSTTATSGTFLLQLNASTWNRFSDELTISESNQSGHSAITLNLNAGFDTSTATGIMCRCDNITGTITIKNVKLEWGNKATSWSPAPEDTDAAIDAVNTQLSLVPGEITAAVTGIKVGGTNLARNTFNAYCRTSTSAYANDTWSWMQTNANGYFYDGVEIEQNTEYRLSYDYEITNISSDDLATAGFGFGRGPLHGYTTDAWYSQKLYSDYGGASGHVEAIVWPRTFTGDAKYFAFRPLRVSRTTAITSPITIKIWNFKLEKGNKATDWSPNPADKIDANLLMGTEADASIAVNVPSTYYVMLPYMTDGRKTFAQMGYQAGDYITIKFHWAISGATTYGNFRAEMYGPSGDNNVYLDAIKTPVATFSSSKTSGDETIVYQLTSTTVNGAGVAFRIDNSVLTFTVSKMIVQFGSTPGKWATSNGELVNTTMTLNDKGIFMGTKGTFQLNAENPNQDAYINIKGLFTADNVGGLTAERGTFANDLTVGGQRVLTLSDVGIPIKVSTSQPSGHGFIWLQPSSVTSVRYTGYTADSRNSTVMFSTSQRTITRSFAAEASNTLANGTFTYTLTFEVMSLSDAQLTNVTFSASATKGSTVSFSASSAITLTKYQTATITLTATSSTNLASNANAISVAITATASSYGGLYLNSKQWMTLTIAKSGGSGTQACNVYYIP